MAGTACLARRKRSETIFSESPTNGENSSAAEMDRNEAVHEEAAALTNNDFPQPGGP